VRACEAECQREKKATNQRLQGSGGHKVGAGVPSNVGEGEELVGDLGDSGCDDGLIERDDEDCRD
jgi:hypothetical protein